MHTCLKCTCPVLLPTRTSRTHPLPTFRPLTHHPNPCYCPAPQVGGERYNLFTGCPMARTATIVLRGGSEQFIDEADRSLHDAIMIVRRALKHAQVVPGGGAIDMEVRGLRLVITASIRAAQCNTLNIALAHCKVDVPHRSTVKGSATSTQLKIEGCFILHQHNLHIHHLCSTPSRALTRMLDLDHADLSHADLNNHALNCPWPLSDPPSFCEKEMHFMSIVA